MGESGGHDSLPLTPVAPSTNDQVGDPPAVLAGHLRKHSVVIAGHRTSVSLENAFWWELRKLAEERGVSLNRLVTEVDRNRPGSDSNLSSALRLYVLGVLRRRNAGAPEHYN